MKSRWKTIALSILVFGLLLSGCLPGQFLGPTITPSPTVTNTPTFTPTFTPTSTATFTPTATSTPVPLLEAIAGNWTGIDKGTVGGDPVPGREVEITIIADCSIGNICGTSTTLVNDELLVSDLVLIEIKDGTYIFEGSRKEGKGGSITLTPLPDGTLSYILDSYNAVGKRIKKTATLSPR